MLYMGKYDNYIIQIVSAGSLTKAAEALQISQPALSLGLNKLEKRLGFKIFNRQTIPLCFTPEGKIYFDYIKKKQILQEDFKLRISTLWNEYNSKVVIGGPEVYTGGIVTGAVEKLLQLYPYFSVCIKSASIGQLIDLSTKREVDCFISTTDKLPTNFVQIPVKKEKIYLCIPKKNSINNQLQDYEISRSNAKSLTDFSFLNNEAFIYLEDWQPLQKKLLTFFKQYSINPVNRVIVNQVCTMLNMSIITESACIASEDALICNGNIAQFCLYALPESMSNRLIYVAYEKDLYVSKATQELIKLLTKTGGATK